MLTAIPETIADAVLMQAALAQRVSVHDDFGEIRLVAGVDAAYPEKGPARAAAAVFTLPELEFVEGAAIEAENVFPYHPGLFCFREGPLVVQALRRLAAPPDVVLVDGHGRAHPRRMGLACWVGLASGLPALGVAKNRLAGLDAEPGGEPGDAAPLIQGGEVLGYVLRLRRGVRPVYVSPGHRMGPEAAMRLALACAHACRTPEPLRRAHALAAGREAL